MFSGSRPAGRRACAADGRKSARGRPVRHPDRTRHAGTRWVTERITSQSGRSASESTTEMTGTNYILDAARNGPKKQRQLLRKERLADGDPFSLLTAHANGRPVYDLHCDCDDGLFSFCQGCGAAAAESGSGRDGPRITGASPHAAQVAVVTLALNLAFSLREKE
jgi:hypothetical protein